MKKVFLAFLILSFFLSQGPLLAEIPTISKKPKVNHLLDKAAQARSQNNLDDAARFYREAIGIEPKNYLLHRNLGILLYEKKDYVACLKSLLKTNELKPNDPYTMIFTAKALIDTGDPQGAIPYLEIAKEQIPDDPRIYLTLGHAHRQLKQTAAAKNAYEKSLELEPKNPEALAGLGKLYYSIKHYDKAQVKFEEALKYTPDSGELWYNLGLTYLGAKELNKAAECMHRSLTYQPNHPQSFNALGVIFREAGLWDLSRKSFLKALEIDPTFEEARENLNSLPWRKQETTQRIRGYPRTSTSYQDSKAQAGKVAVTTTHQNLGANAYGKYRERPGFDGVTGYDPQTGYADTAPQDGIDALVNIGSSVLGKLFGGNKD